MVYPDRRRSTRQPLLLSLFPIQSTSSATTPGDAFLALPLAPSFHPRASERQRRLSEALGWSLRFDSATAVIVVMHRSVDEGVSSVWTGVVELGGSVESLRGDTLIIEPYYILQTQTTSSGDIHIVRFNNKRVLPDL